MANAFTNRPSNQEDDKFFVASQWRMMWWKFRKHKMAVAATGVLCTFYIVAIFCEFFSPADPRKRDSDYVYAPRHKIHFIGSDGFHFRPFVYGTNPGVLDEKIKHWDTLTGREALNLREHTGEAWSVAYSADGRWIAASEDKRIKIWNAVTADAALNPSGHTGRVASIAFSPDGTQLASASDDKTVKVWNVNSGKEDLSFNGHIGAVTSVAFSPDGQRIASASADKTVKVWDAGTGRIVFGFDGHEKTVTYVTFSPDGQHVASASDDGTVKIWDLNTEEEELTFSGHAAGVTSVDYSPDGRSILSVGSGTVRLWDAANGQVTLEIDTHQNAVRGIFSPDGQQIVSGSSDGSVKIWDIASGNEVRTLVGHTSPVRGMAFSPDGKHLATVSSAETWNRLYSLDKTQMYNLQLFVKGDPYKLWGLVPMERHLIGLKGGQPLYLLGADHVGRDLFSQILYGSRISLSIGLVGVFLSLIIGCVMGGISGYLGGWIDNAIQRTIETILCIPTIPLWMGLAAALPPTWPPTLVYFGIVVILSLVGWTGLARVVRGKVIALREEDFALAAQLAGATGWWTIRKHLLPSFYSYIIVSVTLAIPGMILGETTLSYLGIGLRPPAISWGVLLQQAQTVQTVSEYPWILSPAIFVIIAVLAFNFVGDGLRDAADPYTN